MFQTAYEESQPRTPDSSVIFASPHSGRAYSSAFLAQSILSKEHIRSSEDAFVDLLFEGVQNFGAYFLKATAPRAYLDLNRAPTELDPALIADMGRTQRSARVNAGLGVIPRVVGGGRAIYRGKISRAEAQTRIESYWHPYHNRLTRLIEETKARHAQAILLDCHSMPFEATDIFAKNGLPRPDIIIGDRFGASANLRMSDAVFHIFQDAGFHVVRNNPFSGAYITKAYGNPARHQHAIQIEINRALYMDEAQVSPHDGFDQLRKRLLDVSEKLARLGQTKATLAAE